MNKYELAENLTKLANELFTKETRLSNIEEGFIENIENAILDKAVYFEPGEEEFNEINTSLLISQFIRYKAIPEMETWINDDMTNSKTEDSKYIFKIYIKYIPRDANQRSDKEALTFRILVERKVG